MLNIVTALLCEARSVIAKYKLKRVTEIPHYPVYRKDSITLIVSGIGRTAAAGACGFCFGACQPTVTKQPPSNSAWLNIGLAGHSDLDIGTGFMAHRIIDRAAGKIWYPTLVFNPPCITADLLTVDTPNANYSNKGGVDMEAGGFFATANRFTTSELIHSFKVVSDNPANPVRKLTTVEASELIAGKIETIDKLVEHLRTLRDKIPAANNSHAAYAGIISQCHFTQTEKLQLQDKLRKLSLLADQDPSFDSFENITSAKEYLKHLDQLINQQPVIHN